MTVSFVLSLDLRTLTNFPSPNGRSLLCLKGAIRADGVEELDEPIGVLD